MRRCVFTVAWVLLVAVTTADAERLPIRVYTVEDGLAHARVRRIVRDARRFLWFCTIDGLSRFDGAQFVTYRTADGLPDPWVTDLLTTRDGTYWVATNLGANVRCMVEDASGKLYFGTASGIFEVDPKSGDTRRYTTAEGLAKNEVWSALASRRGDIWFGTIAGVSRLDSTRARPLPAPRALITTVHVNGVARLVSELGDHEVSGLTLTPSERGVAIGFFAVTFAAGEHMRYQYRLEGAETDWSPPRTERLVHYSQLAPGHYRFQVRAVTTAGLAGVTPATVAFVILPPVWQRAWFRAGVVVGLTLLVFVGHRYRVARLLESASAHTNRQ